MNWKDQLYVYRMSIAKAFYDGDSVHVNIDYGFKTSRLDVPARFYGVDTAEIRRPGRTVDPYEKVLAYAARDYCRLLMPVGTEFAGRSHRDKQGKYGRVLVTPLTVYSTGGDGPGKNLCELMLHLKLAQRYDDERVPWREWYGFHITELRERGLVDDRTITKAGL